MAEIRFLPVCSNCGTILKYREIEFGEDEFGGIDAYLFKANNGRISPNQCPMRHVELVEYDDDGYLDGLEVKYDYTEDEGYCNKAERHKG